MSFAKALLNSFIGVESVVTCLKSGPSTEMVGYVSALRYTVASLNGSRTSAMSSSVLHSVQDEYGLF